MTLSKRDRIKQAAEAALAAMSDEEDAAITAAALDDPDNLPLDDVLIAAMRDAAARHPIIGEGERQRRGRGPQKAPTKQRVALRLSPDVLAYFRAGGPGWQSRINSALQQVMASERER